MTRLQGCEPWGQSEHRQSDDGPGDRDRQAEPEAGRLVSEDDLMIALRDEHGAEVDVSAGRIGAGRPSIVADQPGSKVSARTR